MPFAAASIAWFTDSDKSNRQPTFFSRAAMQIGYTTSNADPNG